MNVNDISKFRQLFIDEGTTLLNSMEGIILELESDPDNEDLIQEIFRVMHTIKGVSGMYGFQGMSELTHSVENIYSFIRDGLIKVNQEILNLTLQSVDHLFLLLNDQDVSDPGNADRQKNLLKRSEYILSSVKGMKPVNKVKRRQKENPLVTYNIILHTPQSIVDRRINVFYAIKDLAEVGEIRSINPLPAEAADEERWSIFVVGQLTQDILEDALMFVYEYCIIRKVADYDIFDSSEMDEYRSEILSDDFEQSVDDAESSDNIGDQSSPVPSLANEGRSQSTIDAIRKNMNRVAVDSEKLDHLMYLVSELITTTSQINLSASSHAFDIIRSSLEKLDKLSKQFRNNALDIRLIPIRDIIPKYNRLVRDVAMELGKQVEFVTEGMDTELDKSSIDLVAEPLVHMIRNALDHGIESPEERQEKGKPTQGIVKLKAYNSGNNIYIEVSDDGKGLDRDKLLKKAIEKGLVAAHERVSDKDIYDIICQAGFTTANQVTAISGRGVGMDVVRQKISEMRGELEISSQKDKGTVFTIKLQQSIAILDTLLIRSDQMKCLVPLSDVEECSQRLNVDIQSRLRHGTIEYDEELIPFISLRHFFQLKDEAQSMAKMVIVRKNKKRFAIIVDEIVGQHQAVLKPMGELVKNHRDFSAASILGNGEVAFLLDTNMFKYKIKGEENN